MKKLLLLAVAGGLLAGCQSERVAFQFQPATATAVAAPAEAAEPGSQPVVMAAQDVVPAKAVPQAVLVSPPAGRARRPPLPALPAGTRPAALAGSSVAKLLKPRLLLRPTLRPHAQEPAAERGLENIGFFALAVLLGILAGLAALVSLIPGVTFWAGLGYVAAGLVVLFLLYKLFKKK